jgi:ribosomal-protein-alanine N-acetyltransferase
MINIKLESNRLYLREIQLSDVTAEYYQWLNDTEVTRYLEVRFEKNSIENIRDYVALLQNDQNNFLFGIFIKTNHQHIGNIKLGPINQIHRFAEIGLMIGDKNCWGMGYATEAIKTIVGYAFSTLNLNKLIAGCYQTNIGSTKAFEKAGFVIEGIHKKHFYCDDEFIDSIRLGLLNNREIFT